MKYGKILITILTEGRKQWHPTPVLLPGESHGWRSPEGCSPWSRWGSDTTERLHFHFLLSCLGEGNGSPLQCSCLKNPRGRRAWWADVYGVIQSQTRLKWLSSSSSSIKKVGSVTQDVVKREPSCIVDVDTLVQPLGKTIWSFHKKLEIDLP